MDMELDKVNPRGAGEGMVWSKQNVWHFSKCNVKLVFKS